MRPPPPPAGAGAGAGVEGAGETGAADEPPQEPRLVQRLPIATPRAPHVVTDEKPVRSSEHIELKELYAAGMLDADAAHVLSAAAGMLWY